MGNSSNHLLDQLVAVSREFGADPKWVVAGGGNTSLKSGNILYIKASGFPLATIDENGFAKMDRTKLAAIWDADYPTGNDPDSVAERERLVLADMMGSRVPGEDKRPSVETLLHDMLPWPLIVHLHPTLVNGLTCGVDGEKIAAEMFGDRQSWIPVTDPGYVLATVIKEKLDSRFEQGLDSPDFIFLANHGVFVGGEDEDEIRRKYADLQKSLESRLSRQPGTMPRTSDAPKGTQEIEAAAKGLFGKDAAVRFVFGGELDKYLKNEESAAPLTGCLTPDHIVYAGPGAVFLGKDELAVGTSVAAAANLAAAWKSAAESYRKTWGKLPNIALFNDGKSGGKGVLGAILTAKGIAALNNVELLLENALEVCAYAESFGGPLLLEERFVRFIVDWEVENYRSKLAAE